MLEFIIITFIAIFIIAIVPRLRQHLDDLDKKYEEQNKWKENITQHFNGHHQNYGYQDYKYDEEE